MKRRDMLLFAAVLAAIKETACIKASPGALPLPPEPIANLVMALNIAVGAAEATLAAIGSSVGMTAQQLATVQGFIRAFGNAVAVTADESASKDSNLDKSLKIATAWEKAALDPAVIAALPASVQAIVQTLANKTGDVKTLIASLFGPSRRPKPAPQWTSQDLKQLAKLKQRGKKLAK